MKISQLRFFTNIKFAISILLLIILTSIIGTIIPQEESIIFYTDNYIKPFSPHLWKIFLLLRLFNVFKTWWFFTLIILFGICLCICTLKFQFPLLKDSKLIVLFSKKNSVQKVNFTQKVKTKIPYYLYNLKYKKRVVVQHKHSIYAYNGILGRLAPILVHVSLILILIGNILTLITNFKSQEFIKQGEIFQIQRTPNRNFSSHVFNYPIRVNDFWIEYEQNKTIKQYYSDISILNNEGGELKRGTISVNHPLRYKSITIYQTDWKLESLLFTFDSKNYQIPLITTPNSKSNWFTKLYINNEYFLLFKILNGNFSIYNGKGDFIQTLDLNEKLYNKKLIINNYVPQSGLQIKVDEGLYLTYFGYALLIFSTLFSYISFTQYWFFYNKRSLYVSGLSNRTKIKFYTEFLAIETFSSMKKLKN